MDTNILFGKPAIKGTRFTVEQILTFGEYCLFDIKSRFPLSFPPVLIPSSWGRGRCGLLCRLWL